MQSRFPQTSLFCSLLHSHSLTYRNLLHFLMLTMKYQKVKESHLKLHKKQNKTFRNKSDEGGERHTC